jgi:hypothetical protein
MTLSDWKLKFPQKINAPNLRYERKDANVSLHCAKMAPTILQGESSALYYNLIDKVVNELTRLFTATTTQQVEVGCRVRY